MKRAPGRRKVVGVMGAGEGAAPQDIAAARRLGRLIAAAGWVLLTGGRDAGVMRAANQGAKAVRGSLTIGILPSASASVSPDVDVAIITDMGNARNNINVLSSDVVVACGSGGPGTVSEVALALKAGKPVVLLGGDADDHTFFQRLGGAAIYRVLTPEQAIALIERLWSIQG
jgi:uncharacterized protein (TIGR00725 family)